MAILQQQIHQRVQRDKTEGRATDSLAIVLWRSTIAAVELSQSDHGPATSASSIVFVIGSISFSLWARFSDGALRGQHDKPYNRFRPEQQGSQTGGANRDMGPDHDGITGLIFRGIYWQEAWLWE
jgi:hypothetical protein